MTNLNRTLGAMGMSSPGADLPEIVFTRVIAAPPARVFAAWTDPAPLREWWGPTGFTNPHCTVDPRPGGAYRVVMRSPDGEDYPCRGVYHVIEPSATLVLTHDMGASDADWEQQLGFRGLPEAVVPLQMRMTVTFEPLDGDRTQLTLRSEFASVADRDAILGMGAAEGWAQSLEKLDALLA